MPSIEISIRYHTIIIQINNILCNLPNDTDDDDDDDNENDDTDTNINTNTNTTIILIDIISTLSLTIQCNYNDTV